MDDGSIKVRISGTDLPDTRLVTESEFQLLIARKPKTADAILALGKQTTCAMEYVMNAVDIRWTDYVDVPDSEIPHLATAARAVGSTAVGTPAWQEAKQRLIEVIKAYS